MTNDIEFHSIADLLLMHDPKDIAHVELEPIEQIIATLLPYKNDSHLTDTQKRMIFKDCKLSALQQLKEKDKKHENIN